MYGNEVFRRRGEEVFLDDGVRPLRAVETLGAEKLTEPLRCLLEPLRAAALIQKAAGSLPGLGDSGATTFRAIVGAKDVSVDAVLDPVATRYVASPHPRSLGV